jgi:predicted ATPase
MIDRVVGNKLLPASVRQDILERSDGIPLFIEEMTKAVLEVESQSTAEQIVAAVPSSARAVPASLHASLMSRLDRLGAAKEVAQIGAAIGREFSHDMLAAVITRLPEKELQQAASELVRSGLVFRRPAHAAFYTPVHSALVHAAFYIPAFYTRSVQAALVHAACTRGLYTRPVQILSITTGSNGPVQLL